MKRTPRHAAPRHMVKSQAARLDRRQAVVTRAAHFIQDLLDTHSVIALRLSLGLVFLIFGALKFVGLSPAADLATHTIQVLTFGYIAGDFAVFLTAAIETFIGLTLVTGRFLRTGLVTLNLAMVGIMAPLVLFTHELVLPGGPTLVWQYVFKDIVLFAAGLVIASDTLRTRGPRR